MNKKERYLNLLIGILVVAVIYAALIRFVFKPVNGESFAVSNPDYIPVADLSGTVFPLSRILAQTGDTYCFIFDVRDCGTCILKGKEDINSLVKEGKTGIFIMINDITGDTASWASVNEISNIFTLKKSDFYQHITAASTPVMVKFRGLKTESHRYIFP